MINARGELLGALYLESSLQRFRRASVDPIAAQSHERQAGPASRTRSYRSNKICSKQTPAASRIENQWTGPGQIGAKTSVAEAF
jgi:hypothetical protein